MDRALSSLSLLQGWPEGLKMLTLTAEEMILASEGAVHRARTDIRQLTEQWDNLHIKFRGDYFAYCKNHMEACASELLLARILQLPYPNLKDDRRKSAADVGGIFEAKVTRYDNGHLILTKYDRPQDIAVLFIGQCPNYRVAGCYRVNQAMIDKYRKEDQSFWIPQSDLMPFKAAFIKEE